MKSTCKQIQETLAAEGPQAFLEDERAQRHLEECEECFKFLETLGELDVTLRALPTVDAPDTLVQQLLSRPELTETEPAKAAAPEKPASGITFFDLFRWVAVGGAAIVVLYVVMMPSLYRAPMSNPAAETEVADRLESMPEFRRQIPGLDDQGAYERAREIYDDESKIQETRPNESAAPKFVAPTDVPEGVEFFRVPGGVEGGSQGGIASGSGSVVGRHNLPAPPEPAKRDADLARIMEQEEIIARSELELKDRPTPGKAGDKKEIPSMDFRYYRSPSRAVRVGGDIKTPKKLHDVSPVFPQIAQHARVDARVELEITIDRSGNVTDARVVRSTPQLDQAAIDAVKQWKYEPTVLNGVPVSVVMTVTVEFKLDDGVSGKGDLQSFLEERSSTEGLTYKPANGYWANTYLPGDPTMRFLHARLREYDRTELEAATGATLRLHEAAHPVAQSFDPSQNGSLALYVHADRKGITGEERLLLQVGLKGIERQAGRRPTMNLALVLDLRSGIPTDVAAKMRAILLALLEAKELGDRFRLVVAGRPDGVVVSPDEFRFGPLTVALEELLTQEEQQVPNALDLPEALACAIQSVARDDDPTATLGSSMVVLVTSRPIGVETTRLVAMAHQSAVAGIPVSAIGVGGQLPPDEIERLALAGQGRRHLLEQASEATSIVDRELTAASRIVARAVRLRIRLAQGVRLVDIIGSERLDEARAQKVRDAEQSLDLRLARNLGIEVDRGEDEDGIQIVIPNFYSGDEHAILLDVVAPGSGLLADVSVRYKDLAFLKNSVARTSLALGRSNETPGALERNVSKNLLSFQLAEALEEAGTALARGQDDQAQRLLTRQRNLLHQLTSEWAGLDGVDMRSDLAMLNEYLTLLTRSAVVSNQRHRNHLADSLHYASWLKIQPRWGT